jgi:hypothetical protein
VAKLVAAEIVVPKSLDAAARERLVAEMYDVHARIFDGVDRATFVKYVVDSKADETWIQLYRTARGELGGYFAFHVFERTLRGETVAIFRGETGVLREHRGGNVIGAFFADRALRYMARHPGRQTYFLGSLVHPSSYATLATYIGDVWPNAERETPADIASLLDELGTSFGLEQVADAASTLVRKVGWITRDAAADRAYWQRSRRPGVQFFLQANPGYPEGHGLLTLAPLSAGILARGLGRYAADHAEKQTKRALASLRARWERMFPGTAVVEAALETNVAA